MIVLSFKGQYNHCRSGKVIRGHIPMYSLFTSIAALFPLTKTNRRNQGSAHTRREWSAQPLPSLSIRANLASAALLNILSEMVQEALVERQGFIPQSGFVLAGDELKCWSMYRRKFTFIFFLLAELTEFIVYTTKLCCHHTGVSFLF